MSAHSKYINSWTAGKYHYKFIVDGKWMLDPKDPVKEGDGKGHINSVWMVS
ncbi:MAG: glycogen-binding domain-containing protein [Bacteroidota bacterium]